MVQGTAGQVAAIMAWVHRGPPAAMVLRVEEDDAEGSFDGFENLPTL
jgi:hypothetical protein